MKYIDIIHQLNNFSDIIIYLYENQEYNLLLSNNNCINYIIKNLNNFNNLIEYLIYIKNFKFIYNYEEINECVKQNIFDLIIWVDASERLPMEDASSFNIDNYVYKENTDK